MCITLIAQLWVTNLIFIRNDHLFKEMCRYSSWERCFILAFCSSCSETWYTNEHLLMQFASAMGGDQQIFLLTVFVESPFLLSCSFGGFPTNHIMSFAMSQLTFCPRFVQMYTLNPSFNLFQVIPYHTVLQTVMIMPDWMSLPGVFGILVMSKLSWMSGYLSARSPLGH